VDTFIPDICHLKRFIDSLSAIPSSVVAQDREGYYLGVNQATADFTGLKSPEDLIGGTDLDFSWRDLHELYRRNDCATKQTRKPYYCIEPSRNSRKELIYELSVRAPLINVNREVYGVIGIWTSLKCFPFSQILSEFVLASEVLKLDLSPNIILHVVTQAMQLNNASKQWNHKKPLFDYGEIKFSLREAQCLHYMLNNYSARKTADKLLISQKTVEFHIANIKNKVNCHDIAQITNKAIDQGFIDIMFINFD
jgi:DNA-binding CsgD family transcriptional regulator